MASEAEECLGVGFAAGSAAVVVGPGGGVVEGRERGEEHRQLEVRLASPARFWSKPTGMVGSAVTSSARSRVRRVWGMVRAASATTASFASVLASPG